MISYMFGRRSLYTQPVRLPLSDPQSLPPMLLYVDDVKAIAEYAKTLLQVMLDEEADGHETGDKAWVKVLDCDGTEVDVDKLDELTPVQLSTITIRAVCPPSRIGGGDQRDITVVLRNGESSYVESESVDREPVKQRIEEISRPRV